MINEYENKEIKNIYDDYGNIKNGPKNIIKQTIGNFNEYLDNNIIITLNNKIVYLCGSLICVKDYNNNKNEFYSYKNRIVNVVKFNATSNNNGICVSLAEKINNEYFITILLTNNDYSNENIKKHSKWYEIRYLNKLNGKIKQIVSKPKKKITVILSIDGNNRIINIWNFINDVFLASIIIKSNIEKLSIHPSRNKTILLFSSSFLRYYETIIQKKELVDSLPLVSSRIEKENKFQDFTWIEKKYNTILLVITINNILYVFNNDVLSNTININFHGINFNNLKTKDSILREIDDEYIIKKRKKEKKIMNNDENLKEIKNYPKMIFSNQNWFFIATSTNQLITYNIINFIDSKKRITQKINIKQTQAFYLKYKNFIFNSLFSNNDDSIIIVNLINEKTKEIKNCILFTILLDSEEKSPFQSFFKIGYFKDKIKRISVSRCQSIFAALGENNKIKVWDYNNEDSKLNNKISLENKDIIDISLHPYGIFIAIAFFNSIKIYTILDDSINLLKEINLIAIKFIKFSKGGHYLVTNEKEKIIVFDTIFFENICIFEEHQVTPKNILIIDELHMILTNDSKGVLNFWEIKEDDITIGTLKVPQTEDEYHLKCYKHQQPVIYNSMEYDHKNDWFVGCLEGKDLIIYENKCTNHTLNYISEDCTYITLLLDLNNNYLYCGTNNGKIRVHLWPLNIKKCNKNKNYNKNYEEMKNIYYLEYIEIIVSNNPIDHLYITSNYKNLIIASRKGEIFITIIKEKIKINDQDNTTQEIKNNTSEVFDELFMIKNSKLREQINKNKKLEYEVSRLEQSKELELKKLNEDFENDKLKHEKDFIKKKEDNNNIKDNFILNAKNSYEQKKKELENKKSHFEVQLKEINEKSNVIINFERERNDKLKMEIEEKKNEKNIEIDEIIKRKKESLIELTNNLESKLKDLNEKYNNILKNAKEYGGNFMITIEKQEEDFEREIEKNTKDLLTKINIKYFELAELKKNNCSFLNENKNTKNEDIQKQKEFENLIVKNTSLLENKVKICIGLLKMQEQLLEREQVVLSKDQTIKNEKDEQKNLENFRFILDEIIRDLNSNKDNILSNINNKEENLKKMFNELLKQSKKNGNLFQRIKKLMNIIEINKKEKQEAEHLISFWNNNIKEVHKKINNSLSTSNDLSQVLKVIKEIIDQNIKYNNKTKYDKDNYEKNIVFDEFENTNVYEELLNQNKWLMKKFKMINLASENIKEIREENIKAGLKQNNMLIKECNELNEENNKHLKYLKHFEKIIKDGNKKKNKILEEDIKNPNKNNFFKKKKTIKNNNVKIAESLKLPNIKNNFN